MNLTPLDLREHEISVREADAGGAVTDPTEGQEPLEAFPGDRAVLFVHGYNNNLKQARQAYAGFLERLAPQVRDPLLAMSYRFYWPGDKNLWLFSFASYPSELRPADESGTKLANFIWNVYQDPRRRLATLDIHVHSLGGRVVLEAMTILRRRAFPDGFVKRVSMTAPAVLIEDVDPDAADWLDPRQRWLDGAEFPPRLTVLTSERDMVLTLAFPLGQLLGGEPGTGRALGLEGPPPGLRDANREPVEVGHTHYWDCPDDVARAVIDALELTPTVRVAVVARALPSREVAPAREIATRQVGEDIQAT